MGNNFWWDWRDQVQYKKLLGQVALEDFTAVMKNCKQSKNNEYDANINYGSYFRFEAVVLENNWNIGKSHEQSQKISLTWKMKKTIQKVIMAWCRHLRTGSWSNSHNLLKISLRTSGVAHKHPFWFAAATEEEVRKWPNQPNSAGTHQETLTIKAEKEIEAKHNGFPAAILWQADEALMRLVCQMMASRWGPNEACYPE